MAMIFDESLRTGAETGPPRDPVYGRQAVAATAHPLVSLTALDVMQAGGNAVDAAIAAGAMLMLVEPRNGHLGADVLMLVDTGDGAPIAINGTGAAPRAATLEKYRALGGMPGEGLLSSTVPGIISGWKAALERFGTKPVAELLAPAIAAAREGVVVTPRFQTLLAADSEVYRRYPASAAVFMPGGRVPRAGELLRQPLLARSLERLASAGLDDFYHGELARDLVAFSAANNGQFAKVDFEEHAVEVREPVVARYRDVEIVEQPPVSQGLVVLLALRILERVEGGSAPPGSAERIHAQVEAIKLAYGARLVHLGDPRFSANVEKLLLSDNTVEGLVRRFDPRRVLPAVGGAQHPDTTFAAYADATMTVSYIHSLYSGAGVVMGETGALMNSRMMGFSLDATSPNALAPGKRPIHTLNTWQVRRDGRTLFAGGTPGALWQIQTNVQTLMHLIDDRMEVTDAIASPRFTFGSQLDDGDATIHLESRAGAAAGNLRSRGHRVEVIGPWDAGGAMQIVARDPETNLLRGATEIRRPGCTVLAR